MNQTIVSKVTLEDVLRLVLPLDTIVFGDPAGTSINWVSILTELTQIQNQVHLGDIVIMPEAVQQNADLAELKDCLESIAELAAALLTFYPFPEDANEVAASKNLPIVTVIGESTLREVHQGIAGLLVNRQKQIDERGLQLYRRLTEMSREGQGIAEMTKVMSKLSQRIVAVQDKRLDIMALSIPPEYEAELDRIKLALSHKEGLPKLLYNRKAAAHAPQSYWQQFFSIDDLKMARLISPIISGDRARGYVSVVGPHEALDMLDKLTAQYGAAACALEMAKVKAISEAKKELRGNFLEGLLAGTLPVTEIQRLSGRLDHEADVPHVVLTFAWAGEEHPSLRRLETPLSALIANHGRPTLTHNYGNEHICIFLAIDENDQDMGAALSLADQLRQALLSEFPNNRLLCGLSGPAAGLEEWPEVHKQAIQAMCLADRLKMDTAVDFNHIGVYQLLLELEVMPAVQRYSEKIIGPLVKYDADHNSNLVQTLSSYFNNHGNISQTSDMLFIHRNTLLYRLDRIKTLTGQDLDDADERLALQLSLKVCQIRSGRPVKEES
jgi:purine catabolism regulator